MAGATAVAAVSAPIEAGGQQAGQSISKGDAALLRFAAAAEIIESDLWLQYQELAGTQDDEVSALASKLIPGYPPTATGAIRNTPRICKSSMATCRSIFTTTRKTS